MRDGEFSICNCFLNLESGPNFKFSIRKKNKLGEFVLCIYCSKANAFCP